jgi:hypothetical protein
VDHDLAAPDPYYILPVIMIVSMFIQTKLNPTPPDPIQAKVMMAMPFIFGVMFLWFPAGLVLYWVVNNILSIAQQWQITRMIEGGARRPTTPRPGVCEIRHHCRHRHGPRPWRCRRHPRLGQQLAALCFCAESNQPAAPAGDDGRFPGGRRRTRSIAACCSSFPIPTPSPARTFSKCMATAARW